MQVTANTTYVVSYFAPQGQFAVNGNFFTTTPLHNYPLNAPTGANGVYKTSTTSTFPTDSYASSNYWVDVVFGQTFSDQIPPSVISRTPAPGATGVSFLTDVVVTFNEPVNQASISFVLNPAGVAVPANVTYDAPTKTATLHPLSPLATNTTYTATLGGATDPTGNVMSPITWPFGTVNCPCSIWPNTVVPDTQAYPDASPIEVGVKFKPDVNGYVTGVRFFKGAGNTGTHVGNLWSSTGTPLASVTFANESASGWQEALFSAPVQVTANTTYVISYTAPAGRFALNPGYFLNSPTVRFPLRALQVGPEGGNGVYGAPGAFPGSTYNASNYWVDVVFALTFSDGAAPTVIERLPLPSSNGVAFQPDVTAKYSEPIVAASVSFVLRNPAGVAIPSTVTYDPATEPMLRALVHQLMRLSFSS